MKRILLAGGGTAGHVNPLLAVARALRDDGWDVHVLGTSSGLEARLVPDAGFPLHLIDKVAVPRRPSMEAVRFPARLRRTIARVTALVDELQPLAVVGFGGYVAAPAYIAARRRHIPLVIHEQNARPGMANVLGARWADVVATTFSSTTFPRTRLRGARVTPVVVGLPLRDSILDLARRRSSDEGMRDARDAAARSWGLDPRRTTILITGGSLGAVHLNEVMARCAPIVPESVQVVHLTGRGKAEAVREILAEIAPGRGQSWIVREYCDDMEQVLAVADLLICRSGAGMVSEAMALGLPAVYVPLPIGNGEQRLNAADHVNAGGAILIPDAEFTEEAVATRVIPLLDPDGRGEHESATAILARMAEATRALGRLDATDTLVAEINTLVERIGR